MTDTKNTGRKASTCVPPSGIKLAESTIHSARHAARSAAQHFTSDRALHLWGLEGMCESVRSKNFSCPRAANSEVPTHIPHHIQMQTTTRAAGIMNNRLQNKLFVQNHLICINTNHKTPAQDQNIHQVNHVTYSWQLYRQSSTIYVIIIKNANDPVKYLKSNVSQHYQLIIMVPQRCWVRQCISYYSTITQKSPPKIILFSPKYTFLNFI